MTPWEKNLSAWILEVWEEGSCDDVLLLCSDGTTSAPLAMVALTYPSLYEVLLEQESKGLCTHLFMPQFRVEEVFARIWDKMSFNNQVT